MRSDAVPVQREVQSPVMLRLASDERLVALVRAGSERAFEALFDRHQRAVLAFCRHMLGSTADAEDAVQHTFLAAYRDLVTSEKPIVLRPWLYAIARHRCASVLRRRRPQPVGELPEAAVDQLAAQTAAREDLRATLTDVARLPDDQRAALVLAELGDVGHQEIARILGCDRDKVKALVFQARTSLIADRTARETPCAEIRAQLATVGGALRHGNLRRHLRECAGCRAFRRELRAPRRRGLGLLLPGVGIKRALAGAVSGWGTAGGSAVTGGVLSGGGLATMAAVTVALAGAGITAQAMSGEGSEQWAPAVAASSAPAPAPLVTHHAAGLRPAAAVRPRDDVPAGGGRAPAPVADVGEAGDRHTRVADRDAPGTAAHEPPAEEDAAQPPATGSAPEPASPEPAGGGGRDQGRQDDGPQAPAGRGRPAGPPAANGHAQPTQPPRSQGKADPGPRATPPGNAKADPGPPQNQPGNGKADPEPPQNQPGPPPAAGAPPAAGSPPGGSHGGGSGNNGGNGNNGGGNP